jgi:Ca-activated chloride channel homolog
MSFQDLWLLFLIPLLIGLLWAIHQRRQTPGIRFPYGDRFAGLPASWKTKFAGKTIYVRALAIIFLILALARPQFVTQETTTYAEGSDIVLVVDVSSSMLAEDFQASPKRLSRVEAAKEVIRDFIKGRRNDRIGIVVFAAHAYTVSPLTRDHDWLLQNLERVNVGMVEDNTAIGAGLTSALQRIKDTPAKGKVVILLTDGRNNFGIISPLTAAAAAQALQVLVYTVGVGSKGPAPYPVKDPFGQTMYKLLPLDIDEDTLRQVASITKGQYYRATDLTSLKEIFKEIDRLETMPVQEKIYNEREELFYLFLIPGMLLFIAEFFIKRTLLRRIP